MTHVTEDPKDVRTKIRIRVLGCGESKNMSKVRVLKKTCTYTSFWGVCGDMTTVLVGYRYVRYSFNKIGYARTVRYGTVHRPTVLWYGTVSYYIIVRKHVRLETTVVPGRVLVTA
jgi:hypothetical protein